MEKFYVYFFSDPDFEDQIAEFNMSSFPFKKGDVVNIAVKNSEPGFWDVDEVDKSYRIESIEFDICKTYGRENRVNQSLNICIHVTEINNE